MLDLVAVVNVVSFDGFGGLVVVKMRMKGLVFVGNMGNMPGLMTFMFY